MKASTIRKRFLEAVMFREIWDAMKVTFRHMFHRPITFQYPREERTIPDAHRGALGLLRYDDGRERCVGCDLCEVACPSRCIKVISEEDRRWSDTRRNFTSTSPNASSAAIAWKPVP
jgi:NADH-quinone oxidoreductase subunit I